MSYDQLGLVGAMAFLLGLVLEIPSGAIADTYGRKKVLIVSLAVLIISGIFLTYAESAAHLVIGVLFLQTGLSFISGTIEALLYDNLKYYKATDQFEFIISRSLAISVIAVAMSLFVGGYLYNYNGRIPYFLWTSASLVAFVAAFFLNDFSERVISNDNQYLNWVRNFKEGVYELFKPANRFISFSILTTFGVFYYFDWGFYKSVVAIENGLSAFSQSSIFSLSNFFASITLYAFLPVIFKKVNKNLILMFTSLLVGVSFVFLVSRTGMYVAIPIALIIIGGNIFSSVASVLVNGRIESSHRASTLSAVTFMSKVTFIVLSAITGKLIEQNRLDDVTVVLSMLALSPLFVRLFHRNRSI